MLKKLGVQVVAVLLGALVFTAYAQTTTVGAISGTVRDEKGAVVPRAEVSIQSAGTGISRTVNTDDKALRENRLKLLNEIRAATRAVADFSWIEG